MLMHIRHLIFNPKRYIEKIRKEPCKQVQNVYRNGRLAAFTKHPGSDLMSAGATSMSSEVYETSSFLFKYSWILAPSVLSSQVLPLLGCGWGPALLQEEQGKCMPHGNEFPEQLFCSSLLPSPYLGLRKKVKYKTDWFKFKPCPSRRYESIYKESLWRYCFRLPFCGYFIPVLQVKISSYGYSLMSIRFALFFFFLIVSQMAL